jgi:hypothetical protein
MTKAKKPTILQVLNTMHAEANAFRTEMYTFRSEVNERFEKLEERVRGQGADIMEQHERVIGALGGIISVLGHKEILKNHDQRIGHLETDVSVIKTVIKKSSEL